MPIFLNQSRHTLLNINTFSPSFMFTFVNNNTSTIVNTPFFSVDPPESCTLIKFSCQLGYSPIKIHCI